MTDITSEAYGRELLNRTTFDKEAVWVPLLGVHALNAGEPVVSGKTFTDCLIEGPAIITIMGETRFDGCDMGAVEDIDTLLFRPEGQKLVGVIAFKDCLFLRCRFRQIGYTGHPDFVNSLKTGIAPATKIVAQ